MDGTWCTTLAGALLGEKSVRPKSFSQKVRNFFTCCVLADQTPRGGKSQNTGFLGPFWLGQLLALGEIPGQKRKTVREKKIVGWKKNLLVGKKKNRLEKNVCWKKKFVGWTKKNDGWNKLFGLLA